MAAQLWKGRRAPFTLLGGYLGAGKTTIVNHLVGNSGGRRLVVLVNDIGAVNVDAALIARHDGATMSLTNGCVCCSIADDLGQTLEQIRGLPEPPDHVVLELSGVAEPARVAPWASTAGFRLDGIVVAVDADQITTQLARADIGDTVDAQLAAADLIVLTKTDLAVDGGAGALAAVAIRSTAPVLTAVEGVVDVGVVLGVDRVDAESAMPGHSAAPGGYRLSTRHLENVSRVELERLIDELPGSVLRAKGLVRCSDVTHPVEVSVVGRRRRLRSRPDLDGADGVIVVIER